MKKIILLLVIISIGFSFQLYAIGYGVCTSGDCVNGKGTFKDKDGNIYTGDFVNGRPDGQGIETFFDGTRRIGYFRDGIYIGKSQPKGCIAGDCENGQGTFIYDNGNKYVGQWKKAKFHGEGAFTNENGIYVGQWKNGLRQGDGTITAIDGSIYVGQWDNDVASGEGTITYGDGSKYVGLFKNGKYNGKGVLIKSDGSKYIGQWKDNIRNGQGQFLGFDNSKYVGQWKDGKPHGQGTFTGSNGARYVGLWKNGKYHGKGIKYYSDGAIQEKGQYQDGEYIGE